MNYEETLKELEKILEEMESSEINLDEMMEKYKRALSLYKDLEKYLKEYKREIKVITDTGMEDFDADEDDELQ